MTVAAGELTPRLTEDGARYVRSPSDLLWLVMRCSSSPSACSCNARREEMGDLERQVLALFDRLPGVLQRFLVGLIQVTALVVPAAAIVSLAVLQRWRTLLLALLAGVVADLLVDGIEAAADRIRPASFGGPNGPTAGSPAPPTRLGLPGGRRRRRDCDRSGDARRWRRWAWGALAAVARGGGGGVWVGGGGGAVGGGGRPACRLREGPRRRRAQRRPAVPPLPAASSRATSATRGRSPRCGGPSSTRRSSRWPRDLGVRTPRLVAFATAEPNGYVLAYEAIDGRSLDRLDARGGDRRRARRHLGPGRRAHRTASPTATCGWPTSSWPTTAAVWMIDFGFSELAASDHLLATDVAELIGPPPSWSGPSVACGRGCGPGQAGAGPPPAAGAERRHPHRAKPQKAREEEVGGGRGIPAREGG